MFAVWKILLIPPAKCCWFWCQCWCPDNNNNNNDDDDDGVVVVVADVQADCGGGGGVDVWLLLVDDDDDDNYDGVWAITLMPTLVGGIAILKIN